MPEPVIYMRGFPGPSFVDQPAAIPSFIEDLELLVKLSDEQVAAISKDLLETEGFLDPTSLLAVIRKVLPDVEVAAAVRRFLRRLDMEQVDRLMESLAQGSKEKGTPFDEKKLDRIKKILKELIQPYPALVRFEKAERLVIATGQRLESFELICDLRPVFDDDRTRIEGMMPYTRLRIVATDEDGLPKSFEVELSHQQVTDLAEKAEKAKKKLGVLRQFIDTEMPGCLPNLPLTRI